MPFRPIYSRRPAHLPRAKLFSYSRFFLPAAPRSKARSDRRFGAQRAAGRQCSAVGGIVADEALPDQVCPVL